MSIDLAGLCFTSASGLPLSHDPWLVTLSYAVAAFASYAALDMAERMHRTAGVARMMWRGCAAVALGGGIWAMHFIGMLALTIDTPIAYDPVKTLLSLVTSVVFVAAGFRIIQNRRSPGAIAAAGGIVGAGVAAMHYLGMAAMVLPARIAYEPTLWILSVAIAAAAATAGLWLSARIHRLRMRMLAALVMAVAVCGMHYTGMAALVVQVDPMLMPADGLLADGVSSGPLAAAVAIGTFGLVLLALVSAAADRRLSAAAAHEASALRIANMELQATRVQLEATQREIIRRLCSAGEFRDNETGQHVARMAQISHQLALSAGCAPDFAAKLLEAAPLHDIGKIGIPDHVLLKPGRLDAQEWATMRDHATIGHRLLVGSGLPLLDLAAEIAGTHHEKWDGTGYPAGLRGTAIPLSGRIVAIADVFDALLSARPYKEPWPLETVVAHMREQAGRHFDPDLVTVFLDRLDVMLAIRDRFLDDAFDQPLLARSDAAE
ncbi:HD domain-containing protein [Azospirillum sp. YIM B02556]|uniref:HD domain-containing protein n=1 Tax=Azospirillum endophyticum TaxID=2800326 RepID=A0ABS1F238_9PROT|nr:MHYT domain-containing protein [Azospirillum endophyticum]MBK1837491.1 HD domain-containing protein [Azospirillum endophyticum]